MSQQFKARDYQLSIIEHIVQHPRCNIWSGMGTGKSCSTLTALDFLLNVMGEAGPALVLAPLRVAASTWPAEAKKWAHLAHLRVVPVIGDKATRETALRRPADIFTMNYENLPWLRVYLEDAGKDWPFRIVVADECFPAGTAVLTADGETPIESLKPGTLVRTHLGLRKVLRVISKKTAALVAIQLINGTRIVCTPCHRFWTQDGWKPAEGLGPSDLLYPQVPAMRDAVRVSAHQNGQGFPREVLPKGVRDKSVDRGQTKGVVRGGSQQGPERMAERKSFLECRRSDEAVHEGQAERSSKGSGFAPAGHEGWEWEGDECFGSAHSSDACFGVGLESRYTDTSVKGPQPANLLQTRLCVAGVEGLLGSGRGVPQVGRSEVEGHKEDRGVSCVGVAGVSRIECPSGQLVWDIEVEDAHTYFASGVLVHNCTRLKSFRVRQGGARAQALGQIVHQHVDRFINLTGTPAPNGLSDLWGQAWFLDGGQRLGRSFSAFENRWFATKKKHPNDQYGEKFAMPGAQAQIEGALRDVTITVRAADFLDLPPLLENVIEVDMPPSAQRHYREMEREMFTQLAGGEEVEAFNAAALTMKCLQCANGAMYLDKERYGPDKWIEVHDAKLDALESIIEEAAGAPILVAYHFKSDLARLRRTFPRGRALDADPATIRDWNEGKIPLLFAHPASAGHGLNLQDGGNIIVFFGLWWNLEEHEQIIERIGPTRQAQAGHNRPVFVHRIVARGTVDELVVARLKTKASVQSLLLDAMKGQR